MKFSLRPPHPCQISDIAASIFCFVLFFPLPFIQRVTPEGDVSGQAKRKAQITIGLRGAATHLVGTRSRWHQAYRRPPCLWSCSKKPTGTSYGIKNAIVFYVRQWNCTLLAGCLHHNLTTKNYQVIPTWLTWRYPHAQT